MIKKKISRTMFQAHLIDFVRDEMYEAAIKDDGIYSTFKYHNRYFTTGETRITLRYCKLDCDDKWLPAQRKIFYKDCTELGEFTTLPCICAELQKKVIDRIKMDAVKKDDALWSTIKVESCYDHFEVSYDKAYVDNTPDYIKWKPVENPYVNATKEAFDQATKEAIDNIDKAYTKLRNKVYAEAGIKAAESMTAQAMEIENTKKTLQRLERLRENTWYGLYPRRSGSTCHFDEKAKEDLKASLAYYGLWEARAKKDTKEKEKKDMNVTLMVVPEGMNKDFVRKVKANYQSNNSLRLFIASTDIDYSCEHEPIKTKYDLFEKWIKTGYVDVVYFMLGFEKDPDVRAFEAFVRGITEFSGKVDVHVVYQKDDIFNDANSLRTRYFDEADAKEDLEKAGNKVVKEAKTMQDIYGLDDEGLEAIKYSKGRIEVSEGLIMDKIMDVAFAEDEDAKLKKGGKK